MIVFIVLVSIVLIWVLLVSLGLFLYLRTLERQSQEEELETVEPSPELVKTMSLVNNVGFVPRPVWYTQGCCPQHCDCGDK